MAGRLEVDLLLNLRDNKKKEQECGRMLKINLPYQTCDCVRDDSGLWVTGFTEINKESWSFPMHSHDDIVDLVLITHGEGTLWYRNRTFQTKKGDLLVFNQNELHAEASNPENPLSEIAVSLCGVQLPDLPPNHILPKGMSPVLNTGDTFHLMYYLFEFMKDAMMRQEANCALICRETASMVLTLIQHHIVCENLDESKKGVFSTVLEIIEYLDINYNQNIKLDDLSEIFHFSPYYLAHKFKDEMGITINQYITNRRIGEAEKLLIYTDMKIAEVGMHIGYDNLNHFYTTFRKHTGVAPGKLREMYQKKE